MSVNGDPQTGINAWNNLSPSLQNALLVQFYKQGPTPERVLRSMTDAAQNGTPYVPQIGVDGAGATYAANEAAITQALAGAPAEFSSRWDALGPSKPATGGASQSSSAAAPVAAPGNQASPAPPPSSDAPLGIFSGKPMRFFGAPIFDTRTPSAPPGQRLIRRECIAGRARSAIPERCLSRISEAVERAPGAVALRFSSRLSDTQTRAGRSAAGFFCFFHLVSGIGRRPHGAVISSTRQARRR